MSDSFREKKDLLGGRWDFLVDFVLFIIILSLSILIIKPFLTALLLAMLTAYALKPLVDLINKIFRIYKLSLFVSLLILLVPTSAFVYYAAEGTAPIIQKTNEIMIDVFMLAETSKTKDLRFLI